MKILFLASYITMLDDRPFAKNITGYGYMVKDIADSISSMGVVVHLLTTSAITKGKMFNNVKILRRTWLDLIFHIKPYYLIKMLKLNKRYKPSYKVKIRILFYYLSAGYVEHVIKNGNYDLIHIHGIGFRAMPHIDVCERLGVNYVVTLHGLTYNTQREKGAKQLEKNFICYAYNNNIPLTIISTGILKDIKKIYLRVESDINNFFVVTNGINIDTTHNNIDINIRKKYGLSEDIKIMLCVGNLSKMKNQLQVVRAYNLLPDYIKKQFCVLFLGQKPINCEVERKIKEYELENNLIMCGNIKKEEIDLYYKQSDYTVLASISEGFGLSIIEGFKYGLPSLVFADLDAVEDLYDEKVMLTIHERKDESLAKGMIQMLSKAWDNGYIQQYSKKFSLQRMASNYIKVYEDILSN